MMEMKKSRFTDEQMISFIKQADSGLPVADLCRKHGFSTASFYKWRAEAHLDIYALNAAFGVKRKRK
jgi:putative transposase